MELFHSGLLQRALFKGDTLKSKKNGWCILQGGFASFYEEAPVRLFTLQTIMINHLYIFVIIMLVQEAILLRNNLQISS
jgi:hypothetical protein